MNQPPLGLCVNVRYVRCRDGDTPVVRLRTGQEVAVRLKGINAPERNEEGGAAVTERLHELLAHADEIRLWIEPPKTGKDDLLDITDILKALSFERVPGHVFADGVDVSVWLLSQGARAV